RSHARRAKRNLRRDAFEGITVDKTLIISTRTIGFTHREMMIDSGEHPLLIHVLSVMIGQLHDRARCETSAVGLSRGATLECERLVKARLAELVAIAFL